MLVKNINKSIPQMLSLKIMMNLLHCNVDFHRESHFLLLDNKNSINKLVRFWCKSYKSVEPDPVQETHFRYKDSCQINKKFLENYSRRL